MMKKMRLLKIDKTRFQPRFQVPSDCTLGRGEGSLHRMDFLRSDSEIQVKLTLCVCAVASKIKIFTRLSQTGNLLHGLTRIF